MGSTKGLNILSTAIADNLAKKNQIDVTLNLFAVELTKHFLKISRPWEDVGAVSKALVDYLQIHNVLDKKVDLGFLPYEGYHVTPTDTVYFVGAHNFNGRDLPALFLWMILLFHCEKTHPAFFLSVKKPKEEKASLVLKATSEQEIRDWFVKEFSL